MSVLVPLVRSVAAGPDDELLVALQGALDGFDVVDLAAIPAGRLGEVTAAVVDGPSATQLATMANLAFVQSTWVGVDAFLPAVPDRVEVARLVDPRMAATMAEAILAWTLSLHRDMPRYARQQRAREWTPHRLTRTGDRRVGVLGLGVLGSAAALTLAGHGFDVAGWSRSPKSMVGVECLDGDDGLATLLGRSDIVVNLLPSTAATAGLLGAAAFARMPVGSSLINFGRGATVDDAELLAALDRGHLDHAVLDVFTTEPLPSDHAYWTHESVTVLPHVSGPTSIDTAAVIAADNVRRFLDTGELPLDALVDRTRGY